ncbi:1-deoxy-D-xylulose 5-phosphate synthase [Plasmodium brasilianum]|uniref:1-deoxy-D-xylulose 5-phosphate synthase n=1 Tax=Plasmodium brasilianum TaxID=5824 RepID=A0ACB9Y5L5_PLABR|nr:1-deoxy-D-xylulose 5-phosphate synthase [Plasmodium brasilianum]
MFISVTLYLSHILLVLTCINLNSASSKNEANKNIIYLKKLSKITRKKSSLCSTCQNSFPSIFSIASYDIHSRQQPVEVNNVNRAHKRACSSSSSSNNNSNSNNNNSNNRNSNNRNTNDRNTNDRNTNDRNTNDRNSNNRNSNNRNNNSSDSLNRKGERGSSVRAEETFNKKEITKNLNESTYDCDTVDTHYCERNFIPKEVNIKRTSNSNLLFINYFNLKYLRKCFFKKKDFIFSKNEKYYIHKKHRSNSSYSNSTNVGNNLFIDNQKDRLITTYSSKKNIDGSSVSSVLEHETNSNNKKINLDVYFDMINSYIKIEEYKNKYSKEIYSEIIKLYVERDIPEDYEKLFFSQDIIKKSVIFDIDKYDEPQFEKLLQEEFRNNGVFINNIDKKYYNKENILRMKKVLNYLPLLKLINNPSDLKKLKSKYLPLLAHELKIFLYFIVNITGGHFSAGLSLLEMQLLLLYLFDQPYDHVIYDIGHQAYVHKILTGRKLLFFSLRKKKGICGFLSIFESTYDKFGAGHSSTSLSAIQGLYEADWQVNGKEERGDVQVGKKLSADVGSSVSSSLGSISDEEMKTCGAENANDLNNLIKNLSPGRNNSEDFMNRMHIAIIGDGGLTGGMALEALNYISFLNSKVLIIYNDNGQVSLPTNALSISGNRPIGSLSDHLHSFISNKYSNKDNIARLESGNNIFENLNYDYIGVIDGNNTEELLKVLMDIKKNKIKKATVLHIRTNKSNEFINSRSPINIMHSIKINEIFPFDLNLLNDPASNNMHSSYTSVPSKLEGKKIDKNKNSKEEEKCTYSAENCMQMEKGESKDKNRNEFSNDIINYEEMFSKETFTDIYTEEMLKYLKKNEKKIIFISPAMLGGSGLVKISKNYANNVYDVGIAEQHAVTFAASMAMNRNLSVHLSIYSTFLQRAYDQIIHDLNLQKIPITVIIGRSGLIGEDGATHQGIYDLTFLGSLSNAIIISPSNSIDLKKALKLSYLNREDSLYIRLPRINSLSNNYMKKYFHIDVEKEEASLDSLNVRSAFFGKSRIIKLSTEDNDKNGSTRRTEEKKKKKISIFNMGSMLFNVVNAVKEIEQDKYFFENFSFSIIDMIFLNPLDKDIIDYLVKHNKHHCLITYEDNTIGGFSTHFNNYIIQKNYISTYNMAVHNIYIPNTPIEHATYKEQQIDAGMDRRNLALRIKDYLKSNIL